MDVVLITGASTGFGRVTAEVLAGHGYRVFATMRDIAGKNAEACKALEAIENIQVLELDVTKDESVEGAIAEALKRAGQIDVVINNAGFASLGLTEAYSPEEFRELYETNIFGTLRVNRAVLPEMRRCKKGLLIHVTSVLGRVTLPYLAPYCSSKHALESIAEAFRMELAPFGIDVAVIEPGVFNTPIFTKRFTPSDRVRAKAYGTDDYADRIRAGFVTFLSDPNAAPVSDVADTMLRLIQMPAGERPFRTYVGGGFDFLESYNGAADQIRAGVAEMFGLANLLTSKPSNTTVEP